MAYHAAAGNASVRIRRLANAMRRCAAEKLLVRILLVIRAGANDSGEEKENRQADSETAFPEPRKSALVGQMTDVDQHHHEEEEHHDPAGVDEDLHCGDELRVFHYEEDR